MDYFIIAVVTFSGLYFHWWLYRRIRRWSNRDLALSMAGDSPEMRQFMLRSLEQAQQQKVSQKALEGWLRDAAEQCKHDQV